MSATESFGPAIRANKLSRCPPAWCNLGGAELAAPSIFAMLVAATILGRPGYGIQSTCYILLARASSSRIYPPFCARDTRAMEKLLQLPLASAPSVFVSLAFCVSRLGYKHRVEAVRLTAQSVAREIISPDKGCDMQKPADQTCSHRGGSPTRLLQ